jgi:hypothetical protein
MPDHDGCVWCNNHHQSSPRVGLECNSGVGNELWIILMKLVLAEGQSLVVLVMNFLYCGKVWG